MKRCVHLLCSIALLAWTASPALADQTKPMRRLVYTFDISITSDLTVQSSGIDAGNNEGASNGSGMTHYGAGNSDKGTITADILGVQPDTGLVVSISEQGRGNRSAEPATCVTYGIGSVICDPNGKINEEEMSLLRVLGRNFVNPSAMDAKKHWQNVESTPLGKETDDYTVASDNSNGTLGIDYLSLLSVQGANAYTATTHGNLTYNQKLSVPTQIKEDTITRQNQGVEQSNRTEQQLTLTLATDSLAQTVTAH